MSELQMLPSWLDATAAALSGSEPPARTLSEALPGLTRVQALTPLQRLQHCNGRAWRNAAAQANRSTLRGGSFFGAVALQYW